MSEVSKKTGRVVIISGPSGAGKSTVVARLLERCPLPLELSVSATTRLPRPGERDGVHYRFLTQEKFAELRKMGEFLESFEVFGRGIWYGTYREAVSTGLNAGKWIILEIDIHGARQVVEVFPDAISLFVHPGSIAELERRLRGRKTEDEATIQRRLTVAREEMESAEWYDHVIVNQDLESCVQEICNVLCSYRDQ